MAGPRGEPADPVPDAVLGTVLDQLGDQLEGMLPSTARSVRDSLPSYVAVPEDELEASLRRNQSRALATLRAGVSPRPSQTDEAEEAVRSRVAQGVSVEDMILGYRVSIGAVERRFVALAEETGLSLAGTLAGSRLLWELSDAFTTRVATAYQRSQVDQAVLEERRRSEFLRDLFRDEDVEGLAGRARRVGLDPDAQYAAVHARPLPGGDVEQLRRSLELHGKGPGSGGALVTVTDDLCAGVVSVRPSGVGGLVAVGCTGPLAKALESFRLAVRILEVVSESRSRGVVGIEDVTWRAAVPGATAVSRYLVSRYVEPLTAHGEFGAVLLRTVRAYLAHDRNVVRTADALVVHQNTLRHRLARFAELTGSDLQSTDDLVDVSWALASWGLLSAAPPEPSRPRAAARPRALRGHSQP